MADPRIDERIQQLEALRNALDSKDLSTMSRIAHTLKGASAMMAAPVMREEASRLEVASKQGELQEATRGLNALLLAFEAFQDAVRLQGIGHSTN